MEQDPLGPGCFDLSGFIRMGPVFLVCPRCEGPFVAGGGRRSVCRHCGFTRQMGLHESSGWYVTGEAAKAPADRRPHRNHGSRSVFLRHWAVAEMRYGRIFVLNRPHLDALAQLVLRPDRYKARPIHNKDWRSRTPGWITARKNRAQVQRVLQRFDRRLAEAGG